ncbi:inorganic diphosphatase [Microvirga sp. STR05]|uniref:inorganic diphosphatase n=1 Tax=Hymenobacter duratus TaxID=2771356 RepID=A0ABR8JCZ6_9BACT|nr:inorganic diphosphatase [Hymenobacter duratus]MBD2714696.1 inorganic diphosphatase [Hymenobacter duratus]MBR7949600.1 inorganic diphosphatase [Microvirga sp. STR05]
MRFSGGALLLLLNSMLLYGCRTDIGELSTFSAERKLLQVVVEMPAGTNHAKRYDAASGDFVPERRAGLDLVVEFLPCPGNSGFIPGTAAGPIGSPPLAALVLSEAQPSGTVLEVLPIGLLTLDDNGTMRPVVLAVPARPSQQILPEADSWQSFISNYPGAREVVRQWYLHLGRRGEIRIVSWKDEKAAEQQVRAAMK